MKIKLYPLFFVCLVLNALGSVSIYSIPAPWIGMILIIMIGILVYGRSKTLPSWIYLAIFCLIALGIILNISQWNTYERLFPSSATTSYPLYVGLRYANLIAFLSSILIVVYFCKIGFGDRLINDVVNLGVAVAVYSLYVYIAQITGLPELIPRTRIGTGGEEQSIEFSYSFHRAMGSFREPSHLAEWLMLPFALTFAQVNRNARYRTLIIGSALLLTGSMTGIFSIIIAFIFLLFIKILNPKGSLTFSSSFWPIAKTFALLFIASIIIDFILDGLLFEVIKKRSLLILVDGLSKSNRDYVYEYLQTRPAIPVMGIGMGNLQIDHGLYINNALITSVLNLYINILHSFGILGFALFMSVITFPLLKSLRNTSLTQPLNSILLGYCAWMVAFFVQSEEPSILFGLAYGLLVFWTGNQSYSTKADFQEHTRTV
jgi:hypothetical protein